MYGWEIKLSTKILSSDSERKSIGMETSWGRRRVLRKGDNEIEVLMMNDEMELEENRFKRCRAGQMVEGRWGSKWET